MANVSSTQDQIPPVLLDADGLQLEDLVRVAVRNARLVVAPEVYALVAAGRAVVERALAGNEPVYGLHTGLGHRRDQRLPYDELLAYQQRLIDAHVGGIGHALPAADVRALLVARIAGMARGGSGVHAGAFEALVALLNAGVIPVVPETGSVGASDLVQLAAVAQVLIGRGQAQYQGTLLPGKEALARAGLQPYLPQPKDGLALISANSFSIGCGALAVLEAERIAMLADGTGALSLEAHGGNPSPFEAAVAAAKPIAGQIASAAHLRVLLAGSARYDPEAPRSLQDPLSWRVMPQVHGALREQITQARLQVELELNASGDNPLASIVEDRLISNGNFHPMLLALSFEALRVGIAHTAMLAERRIQSLRVPYFGEGLPAGDRHVEGLLSYTAAAVLAQIRYLAHPITLECPPLDVGVEDHATLAPLAVSTTRQSLAHLETLLVLEAIIASDMLADARPLPKLGTGTSALYAVVRAAIDGLPAGIPASDAVSAVRTALQRLIHPSTSSTVH